MDNPEIKLNNEFQVYVKNYRRAYNEETDEDDKNGIFKMTFWLHIVDFIFCHTEHGEQGLTFPCGPSFRKLVDLFCDTDDDIIIITSPK